MENSLIQQTRSPDESAEHAQDALRGVPKKFGLLAREYCNKRLPVAVLESNAGFYIGTFDEEGPCSRESVEYFASQALAYKALESDGWTQKLRP